MAQQRPSGLRLFADLILGLGLLFSLLLLAYALYRGSVRGPDVMLKYYAASVLGVGFFGVALWRFHLDLKLKLAVATTAVGLALYMAEFSVGVLLPALSRGLSPRAGELDERSPLEVVVDLRSDGVTAYPTVNPQLFIPSDGLALSGGERIFPLGGVSGETTVFCNESGQYVVYEADEHGFNNPEGTWTHDRVDLVLVGDSFAHGACVERGQDIAGNLRRAGWSVLNVGYEGNGPLIALATLTEFATPFAPKAVVWLYYEENDRKDLRSEKRSSLLRRYLGEGFSQELGAQQASIDRALVAYVEREFEKQRSRQQAEHSFNSGWVLFLKLNAVRKLLGVDIRESIPPDELFEEILRKARDRVSSWGGQLYFVYLPSWDRYGSWATAFRRDFAHRSEVLARVRGLGVPIVDISEVLEEHADPLSAFPFRRRGHYSEDGYRLVASQIESRLGPTGGEIQ